MCPCIQHNTVHSLNMTTPDSLDPMKVQDQHLMNDTGCGETAVVNVKPPGNTVALSSKHHPFLDNVFVTSFFMFVGSMEDVSSLLSSLSSLS